MFLKERLEHDLILFRNRVAKKMTHEVTATSATSRKKMKETMKEEKANQDKADAQERKIKRRTKGFTEDQLNTRPSQLLSVHADCRKCRRKLIFIGMQTIKELSAQGCYFCKSPDLKFKQIEAGSTSRVIRFYPRLHGKPWNFE
jgi:hypothetical protein